MFYQDYIKIPEDGLEKFQKAYDPKTSYTAPVGITKDYEVEPNWDWRIHREYVFWNELELDWGAVPKDALYEVGGFDERMDGHWSMDNVSLGKRLDLMGYKFGNLIDNRAIALDHDSFIDHPFRDKYNPSFVNGLINEYERNPVLTFL